MSLVPSERRRLWGRGTLWFCALVALATAIVPFARACFRVEVDYNEGWNIYNASTLANHGLLYPVKYGWTAVNYPMLSFVLMAQLHRLTHEYLFTARAVSLVGLIGCSVLVGAVVRRLGGSAMAAWLGGLFCFATFCANTDIYVGMDDPQMFAQVFFMAGLWVYLRWKDSFAVLTGVALLFVVGGMIKHNPIDFPLAVLVELCLVSRLRAVWFSVWGMLFTAVGVWLNVRYGGPFFMSQLLAPRVYMGSKVPEQFLNVFGPMLVPFCVALWMAFAVRKDQRRIAAILLVTAMAVGGYFGGGQGVSINCLFTALLAMSILIGLFIDAIVARRWSWTGRAWAAWVPIALFGWMAIPMILSGNWNVMGKLRELTAEQRQFDAEVALLRERPGPALCESLLECNFAGKDYVYDPFNATRLIHFGKLDAGVVVNDLRMHRYGAVQMDQPVTGDVNFDRFDPAIVAAVKENYAPVLSQEDAVIYVPK